MAGEQDVIAQRRRRLAELQPMIEAIVRNSAKGLNDERDVEDVLALTLERLDTHLDVLDFSGLSPEELARESGPSPRLFGWVKVVSRYLAMGIARKNKREPSVIERLDDEKNLVAVDQYVANFLTPPQSIGSEVANRMVIDDAFDRINEQTRRLLDLKLRDDYSYAEIAEMLNSDRDAGPRISVAGVESRIRRARSIIALSLYDAREDLLGRGR